jgi:hypothetical protein
MTSMGSEASAALRARWLPWAAMALCALLACAVFAVPMYVIRPFRAQGATELAIALVVRRWGPGLAIVCTAASMACAVALWRAAAGWRVRLGVASLALVALVFTAASHVNVYEIMFHPAGDPRFEAADKSALDKDDMVLSVALGGESHAYPVRTMAYHHIANDWVGGVPVAATY